MPRISTIFILIFGTLTVTGEITLSMEAVGALTLTVGVLFLAQDIIELRQEARDSKNRQRIHENMLAYIQEVPDEDETRDFTIDDFYKGK